jgi:hypothetical protein
MPGITVATNKELRPIVILRSLFHIADVLRMSMTGASFRTALLRVSDVPHSVHPIFQPHNTLINDQEYADGGLVSAYRLGFYISLHIYGQI